jgi:hypothetical protein
VVPVAATQALELLVLFVVLPFVVAGLVIAFVSWRSGGGPPPIRTSEVLATGVPGQAEIVAIKAMTGFLDTRPMVRISLRVTAPGPGPFDLEVTQSIPRSLLRDLTTGSVVDVRLTPDHTAGAVVLGTNDEPGA